MKQFLKFSCVGVSNAVVSYIVYLLAMWGINIGYPNLDKKYLLAQLISFVLSVAWSFFWNERYVFSYSANEKTNRFIALIKAYISYSLTGLLSNSVLLVLWIDYFEISEYISPMINMVINVPLNYFINKYWVYRKLTSENE